MKYNLTEDHLIVAYKRLRARFKRQPSSVDFKKYCYSLWTVTRIFGDDGWEKLVRASGDTPLRRKAILNLTAQHLMDDFLDLQKKLGRRPRLPEYTKYCHTPKLLDKKFGRPGWRHMLKKLGVEMTRSTLTADDLIRDYLDLRKEMGKNPTIDQYFKRRRHSYKQLTRVFVKRPWTSLLAAVKKAEKNSKQP